MSNRLYTVHPRRNDRFLKASPALRSLYPDVDFTEFNFTRHLLTTLYDRSPEAFRAVESELKQAWIHRMRLLIRKIDGPVALLWMSERRPEEPDGLHGSADPLFVDRLMINALRDDVADIIETVASDAARTEGLENKVFSPMSAPAALEVPGLAFHTETALALADGLDRHLT